MSWSRKPRIRVSATRPPPAPSATSFPTVGRTNKTYELENPKRVYYLSIEFLIGRSLANNIMNLLLDPMVEPESAVMAAIGARWLTRSQTPA